MNSLFFFGNAKIFPFLAKALFGNYHFLWPSKNHRRINLEENTYQ